MVVETLSAQLVLGLSGLFEQPTVESHGINIYSVGGDVNVGYQFYEEKIVAGVAWQYKKAPNLPWEYIFTAYMVSLRYFPLNQKQNRPYLSGGIGYYQTKDTYRYIDGSSMSFREDGTVISPAIGLLSAFRFIPGVYWDFSVSYQYYSNEYRSSSVGLNAGLKYLF